MPYKTTIELEMRKFYNTLSEKDKRRYAAIETMKLGHGGITYIAQLLGCSPKPVFNTHENPIRVLCVPSRLQDRVNPISQ
jgi:hypothetical protein